jgi:hypothetical protein
MDKLAAIEQQVLASPDQQISLTDPDSRSMATSGRGSGVVSYNVQTAVDTEHHLIVAHEVTNVGNDTAHLANTAKAAKTALHVDRLEAVADRGYFDGEESRTCDQSGITVMTSAAKSAGRFGGRTSSINVYRCPAGEKLKYYYTNEEKGQTLHRYWTNACGTCALKANCTKGTQRRITRWEHESLLEAAQARLDRNPGAMPTRRETVEHPFGSIKIRMGHALLGEDVAQGCHRDGVARARLQFDTCTEYYRHQADAGGGHGVKRPDFRLCTGPKRSRSSPGARGFCRWSKSEKYARKRLAQHIASQPRPVKGPEAELSHGQDPKQSSPTLVHCDAAKRYSVH